VRAHGRSWRRWIAAAVAVVAALVVAGVVAARLWLGSERGRRTVERKVDEAVATHAGGHVRIGAIAGTLIGGVTLDDVEWRDDRGRTAFRARRVVARYSAAKALGKRPSIELRIERPDVDLDRLTRLEVVDATIHVAGLTVDGVALMSRGRGLRWERSAGWLDLDGIAVRVGGSGATASGHVDREHVDARLASLRLAPEDLRRLSPRAEAPRTPLVGDVRLHGPLDDAAVDGELRPDRGRIALGGRVDLRARNARLIATLADVETDYTPAVVSGTATLRAAVAGARLVIDGRADGRYFRREADPNLPASATRVRAVAAVRPGGRFDWRGRLVARVVAHAPTAELRFRLRLFDPGQAARLLAGPDLRNAAAPLILDGVWRLPAHQPPTLSLTKKR
jgi:autotransporter translocation and assembly factor TamB